ncbi:MAG TPA: YggS family pyridoxal phosphate-dependent enzyme [Nitrolancea sp.]|nr:YggS family pyridoxal phosphate-dependent enzyme [Nitrolancea sp.]
MAIEENYRRVLQEVREAEAACGRPAGSVRIVGVTKTVGRNSVDRGYAVGLRDFGENRVQDAKEKFTPPLAPDASLHLIGYLQTNKARDAVALFDTIHSVDRSELIQALERRAALIDKTLKILIQVNIAAEAQKHGCEPSETADLVRQTAESPHLEICGLMTIAPLVADPETARPVFRALRELKDQTSALDDRFTLPELSMGMTNDYVVAIQEGATIVRVGRAIFAE